MLFDSNLRRMPFKITSPHENIMNIDEFDILVMDIQTPFDTVVVTKIKLISEARATLIGH